MVDRLIAIGDVHGCFDSLCFLIEERIKISKRDRIILLGDYIDRGKQSKEVVDLIIRLRNEGFDIIPLLGNHELMLQEALLDKNKVSRWLLNGGYATLDSFKINNLDDLNLNYIDFFKSLKYYYSLDNYLFVHAGFDDTSYSPFENEYKMVWECRSNYSNPVFSGKTIVHGHSPITRNQCEELVLSNSYVLDIDTGCVYKDRDGLGQLTAFEGFSRVLF